MLVTSQRGLLNPKPRLGRLTVAPLEFLIFHRPDGAAINVSDPTQTFSPASKLDTLSDQQKQEVEAKSRPSAALIHETIRAEGMSELERTAFALLVSALAAGLSMGFSLIVQGEL